MPSSLPAAQEVSRDHSNQPGSISRQIRSDRRFTAIIVSSLVVLLAGYTAITSAETRVFDGKWLHRVPDEDRARKDPLTNNPQAIAAGHQLFLQNCMKCHGPDANGKPNRPSLRTDRIRHATDGELAWLLLHGNPFKGMPQWSALSDNQRWQIIAYLRTLPPGHPAPGSQSSSSPM